MKGEQKRMAQRKSYCKVDDTNMTVICVPERMSKKEQELVKGLIGIGYKLKRVSVDVLYPAKNLYSKENVEEFLKLKGEDAVKKFEDIKNSPAVDKETGLPRYYSNGKERKKGYIAALADFKKTYEKEYLEYLDKKKEEEAKEAEVPKTAKKSTK